MLSQYVPSPIIQIALYGIFLTYVVVNHLLRGLSPELLSKKVNTVIPPAAAIIFISTIVQEKIYPNDLVYRLTLTLATLLYLKYALDGNSSGVLGKKKLFWVKSRVALITVLWSQQWILYVKSVEMIWKRMWLIHFSYKLLFRMDVRQLYNHRTRHHRVSKFLCCLSYFNG